MAKGTNKGSGGSSFSLNLVRREKEIERITSEIADRRRQIYNILKDSNGVIREYKDLSESEKDTIGKIQKSLSQKEVQLDRLKTLNDELKDGTEEYDSTLRSIGSRYGEINSVYKESEKILESTKLEISGIFAITNQLSSANKEVISNILKAQKGYRGITTSIVENIGSLEDSEGAYKRIGIQIDEQKNLIEDTKKQLDGIDKSDENQLKIAEKLKKQLTEQASSLDKMKSAAEGVEARLKGVSKAASVLGQTPVGSFLNDMLAGVQQLGRAFGAELPGSIDDLLEGSKKSIARSGLSKIQKIEGESQIPPPTQPEAIQEVTQSQMPQPSPIQSTTQNLEEIQTKAAEKTSNAVSRLADAGKKRSGKRAELEAKELEKKEETSIPLPTETSIDNSKETSITNVTNNNVAEGATPTTQPDMKPIETGMESLGSTIQQDVKDSKQDDSKSPEDYAAAAQNAGTDAMGSIGGALGKVQETAEKALGAGLIGGGGPTPPPGGPTPPPGGGSGLESMVGKAGTMLGIGAALVMLGSAIKDSIKYFDSLEDATDTLARSLTIASMAGKKSAEQTATEALGDLNAPIGEFGSKKMKEEVRGTKEFRTLAFDYSIGQAVKQRQALQDDYFNYEKQGYMDMVGYQQSLVTDEIDYEIGLQRDAMQFGFQQAMANLEAEGEKRKTLAGSAMKFIGQYSKISERALNAIGSSTKAIMDGMKQFGAVLGGTNKSQFELVENAQGLAYAYGGSSDQVLNMSHMFKMLGNTTEKAGMQLVEGMKEFVGQDGNVQAVFSEIAEASADIYRLMSATPEQIVKQTKALAKAGVKLTSMLKASDTMVLNYKDSIKAEMSLGAMLGQNVQFTEARAALMAGDMTGAANAIRDSLAGIDVNQLDPFAKQELAKATGLTMDQIIQIQQGGEIESEDDKQLKMAELTGKTIAKATLNQDIANQSARLALEQAQRKELLEFEQRVRLLMLNVEQAKRLQMIPIEAAYRAKYAKEVQFPQEIDNMMLGVYREALPGTFNKLTAESFQQMGDQMMGAYGLSTTVPGLAPTIGTYGGGAGLSNQGINIPNQNVPAGIGQLQTTISSLNKNIPSIVSMTDPRYAQYMVSQFKMGEEFQSKVSKKGMTDEQKSKIALDYEQKAKNLYETTFAGEIKTQKNNQQINEAVSGFSNVIENKKREIQKSVDGKLPTQKEFRELALKYSDNNKIEKTYGNEAKEWVTIDGERYNIKHQTKLNEVIQNKLEQQRLEQIKQVGALQSLLQQGKITEATFASKLDAIKNGIPVDVTKLPPSYQPADKDGNDPYSLMRGPQGGTMGTYYKKMGFGVPFLSPGTGSPIGPAGPVTGIGTGFGMGMGTPYGVNTQPGGNVTSPPGNTTTFTPNMTTGPNTYVPPPQTTPPKTDGVATPSQVTVNLETTDAILSRIQSEAHSRGITVSTAQNTATAYIKSSAEKLHYAKVAVEGTKMDSTRLVKEGIPSSLNLEKLQIEAIKQLGLANDLLGIIANNSSKDGTTYITLNGEKIGSNFKAREGRRNALGLSNGAQISP